MILERRGNAGSRASARGSDKVAMKDCLQVLPVCRYLYIHFRSDHTNTSVYAFSAELSAADRAIATVCSDIPTSSLILPIHNLRILYSSSSSAASKYRCLMSFHCRYNLLLVKFVVLGYSRITYAAVNLVPYEVCANVKSAVNGSATVYRVQYGFSYALTGWWHMLQRRLSLKTRHCA